MKHIFWGGLLLLWMPRSLASELLEKMGAAEELLPQLSRIHSNTPAAAYFNPALLVLQRDGVQVGFVGLWQRLEIGVLPRPKGVDIFESIYEARKLNPDGTTSRLLYRPLPSDKLPASRQGREPSELSGYLSLGGNLQLIPQRLALGFYAVFPTSGFQGQSSFFPDEREQYFSNSLYYELYEDSLRGSIFSLALAFKPFERLAVGLGGVMSTRTEALSEVYIPDASSQQDSYTNSHTTVSTRLVPHLGLVFFPWGPCQLAITTHMRANNRVTGRGQIRFWDYEYPSGQDSLLQPFVFVYGFEPWRVSLSASYSIDREGWSWKFFSSLLWSQWSAYRNRHDERPMDDWSDTFSAATGILFQWQQHEWALGLGYFPSPVPEQTGRTNYVDNERTSLSLGWKWDLEWWKREFRIFLGIQAQHLLYRKHSKSDQAPHPVLDEFPDSVDIVSEEFIEESRGLQTNNPGYPGFKSTGWLVSAAMLFQYFY